MRLTLIISGIFLLLLSSRSKAQNEPILYIDDSKITDWITDSITDYQSSYHFSQSELESSLILIIDHDSCYAQIKSGYWAKIDRQDEWIQNIENLENIKIFGNKFFSSKTDGEFVIFNNEDNKPTKGLLVYKPWSTWIFYANNKDQEIGFSEGLYFPGKYSNASVQQLEEEDLLKMTKSDLQIMRNEIYARHGYIFKSGGEMDIYFKQQSWYHGQYKNIDKFLTPLENRNLKLIQSIEKNKNGL